MEVIRLDELYLTAMEHVDDPRNMGPLQEFNGHAKTTGPCGDTMEFWIQVQEGSIKKASFITDGCGPSIASGSMTTCSAQDKKVGEAKSISQKDVLEALEGLPDESQHCALLAANTLKAACDDYLKKQKNQERI